MRPVHIFSRCKFQIVHKELKKKKRKMLRIIEKNESGYNLAYWKGMYRFDCTPNVKSHLHLRGLTPRNRSFLSCSWCVGHPPTILLQYTIDRRLPVFHVSGKRNLLVIFVFPFFFFVTIDRSFDTRAHNTLSAKEGYRK